ncbi:cell division protein ZapA [Macrococcus hajekii]|uniref:Cell division protein ZapA n=1 Tax=Macrococcus hajekii TaxID=198482 RepID=A0A4R6BM33_9STAP|nr:cell division protein ZapA [Macrococcus hajekii]TDM02768.1 cell division protein ZapA [Macrococcus hajekii]GGB03758.1 cell division protein ZapA [Macrococcus hajekii]
MSEFKNRITVSIYDQHYTIVGQDEPSHIRYVAGLVDERLREISRYNSGLDTSRKAVLTAVNIMDDYVKLKEDYERLLHQLEAEGQKHD